MDINNKLSGNRNDNGNGNGRKSSMFSGYTNGGGEVSLASTVFAEVMDEEMQPKEVQTIMHLVKIFESHLNQRFKHFENVMNTKFAEAKESMDEKFAEAKESTNIQFANVDKRFDEFKESMNEKFAEAKESMNEKFAEAKESTNSRFDSLEKSLFFYMKWTLGCIGAIMITGAGFLGHLIFKLLGG